MENRHEAKAAFKALYGVIGQPLNNRYACKWNKACVGCRGDQIHIYILDPLIHHLIKFVHFPSHLTLQSLWINLSAWRHSQSEIVQFESMNPWLYHRCFLHCLNQITEFNLIIKEKKRHEDVKENISRFKVFLIDKNLLSNFINKF